MPDEENTTEKLQLENERLKQQIELLQTQRQLHQALTELKARKKMPEPREMESLVSKFDPKDPTSLTAEEWIKSIDSVARSYNWTDDAKLYCARLQLQGAARLWFEGVRDEVADWTTFSAAIKLGFPSSKGSIYYHNLMQSRCRSPNETIEEFVYGMNAMGKRGGFDEQTIATYIINGLSAFLSQSKVSVTNTNTVQDLLTQLKWIERLQDLAGPSTDMQRAGLMKPTSVEISSGSNPIDARSKIKKCFRCHQEGHWKQECPLAGQRFGNNAIKVIQRQSSFVKPVIVGDMSLTALVDTGAKVSTIQQCYAVQCGDLQPCEKVLQGFGLKQVVVKSLCAVKIVVDQVVLSAKLHVVPDYVQEMPIIIGEDIIDQDNLVMVKRGSEVRFQLESVEKIEYSASENPTSVLKIDVAEENNTMVLAAQSQLPEMINNYRSCFSKTMEELGVANDIEKNIVLKDKELMYVIPKKLDYTRETARGENESPDSPVVLAPKKKYQCGVSAEPDDHKWDEKRKGIQRANNNSPKVTTGYNPRDLHRHETVLTTHDEDGPSQQRTRAVQRMQLMQHEHKHFFDRRRRGARDSQFGDLALAEKDLIQSRGSNKLELRFKEPYARQEIDRYRIESRYTEGNQAKDGKYYNDEGIV